MDRFPTARDIASGYDAGAAEYTEEFADELDRKPFDRELLTRFAAATAGRGMVADVGCGPGHVTGFLAARGVDGCGIDISGEMVTIARQRNPEIPFVVADLLALAFASATLVGINAFYSLIHLPRELVPVALVELRRVLRSDGRLLLAVHAGEGAVRRDRWYDRRVNIAATLFGADELAGYLSSAGFVVERSTTRPPYDSEYQSERIYILSRATAAGTRP